MGKMRSDPLFIRSEAMNRPAVGFSIQDSGCSGRARGFTLIEVLVATTLTLLLMGAVVTMFGRIGNSVADSRSTLEMADRLRSTAAILQKDLAGLTVTPIPPRRPDSNEGYLEIIEGPVGNGASMTSPQTVATNTDTGLADTTVADFDDILMFTTRSNGRPFVGRYGTGTIESDVAEVAWFVRGRTLYRRQLLVVPAGTALAGATGFYATNDISVRVGPSGNLAPNTLGDLTQRECRYAHPTDTILYDVRRWGLLGLPTLQECSSSNWSVWNCSTNVPPTNGNYAKLPSGTSPPRIDFWNNNSADRVSDPYTPLVPVADVTRAAEDVILTNVIGFDVKVWDPLAVAYVDLGYSTGLATATTFSTTGNANSGIKMTVFTARVYDTWSTTYLQLTGFDRDSNGIVDDINDAAYPPPYAAALRGLQVKIRTFEPSSRQIREVTVIQDFLPK
jgi:prepilin-type N-terminal cleavage/methylation domain-containing protein